MSSSSRNRKSLLQDKTSHPVALARAEYDNLDTGGRKKRDQGKSGARHIPHYVDQHEDYVPVSRHHLQELSTFGWLQEGAGAVGMFFFSGAFWLLATMLYEHSYHLSDSVPEVLMCIMSMIFGLVLVWIGYEHFRLKQNRIQDIFREHPANSPE